MDKWLSRVIENPRWLWLMGVVGVLLLGLGGGGWWAVQNRALPNWSSTPAAPTATAWAAVPPATLAAIPDLPTLQAQYPALAEILGDPSIGSVYKDFLVAYQSGGLQAARTLAEQRGLLDSYNQIRFTLQLDDAAALDETLKQLEELPVKVTGAADDEINVQLSWGAVEVIHQQAGAGGDGLTKLFEKLRQLEHVARLKLPITARRQSSLPAGSIQSEGVAASGADAWHAAGFTGQGIHIAIFDLGFAGYHDLLGAELPANVTTVAFGSPTDEIDPDAGEPHGAACAEIVHDMAPDAKLTLIYFDGSDVAFKQAVQYIQQYDIQVVSYSVGSAYGPHDGTGESAELVDALAAAGVLWVGAMGNEATSHYRDTFTDADGDGIHEFPNGEELLGVQPYNKYQEVLLQWDDWQRSSQDYDLYLYDENGDLLASSTETQDGSRFSEPVEYIEWQSRRKQPLYIQIRQDKATTNDTTLEIFAHAADLAYYTPAGSITSPADARGSFSVGAVTWWDQNLADYSSQGPTADGRLKPEISAPTSVSGASYGEGEFNGTSAATPHVAGAAALVWSRFPDFNRDAVVTFLQDHALDLRESGPDAQTGYGWLQFPIVAEAGSLPPTLPASTQLPVIESPTLASVSASPTAVQMATLAPAWEQPSTPEPPYQAADMDSAWLLWATVAFCGLACCGGSLLIFVPLAIWLARRGKGRAVAPADAVQPAKPAVATATPDAGHRAINVTHRTVQPDDDTLNLGAPAFLHGGLGEYIGLTAGATVGRAPQNQVVLADLLVSRTHARFELRQGQWWVVDLNSANGTFVNMLRVHESPLQDGDNLRFHEAAFTFRLGKPVEKH